MKCDPRDDFSVFAGSEHMFFGFQDPAAFMRREVEHGLRKQVADTVVEAIRLAGTPKFLTLGRKIDDGANIVVTWFGTCVAGTIVARAGGVVHTLPATLTVMLGRVDEPGSELSRITIDIADDAAGAYDDDVFRDRFLGFRNEDRG